VYAGGIRTDGGSSQFRGWEGESHKERARCSKPLTSSVKYTMARISGLTLPEYQPDFLAESLGSGTDSLIPGGLPLDITTVPLVNGKRVLQAGSIVNRLFATDPTAAPLPFKYWNNASTDALQDFYFVAFQLDDASGVDASSNADPGCIGIRDGIMIYEDRLPAYWAAVDAAKKAIVRQKYTLLTSRRVAL
jgi:hypothetical protein